MNYQDPEWTDADGTERGPGAIAWLMVGIALVTGLSLAALWIWM